MLNARHALLLKAALAIAVLTFPAAALAQVYPAKTVSIVVPFSAGSVTDIMARIISDEARKQWGQPVIVVNRPGLAGNASVANAVPDGYTLMLTANAHTVLGVNEKIAFDPIKDFVGITRVASAPLCLVVPADFPAKNLRELIALAKNKPGTLNVASPGIGGATYIAAAVFMDAAGINIAHISYKGGPDSAMAVVTGEAHMFFAPITLVKGFIETGRLRAIAMGAPARLAQLADVPTYAEAGMKFDYDAWFGLMAPAGVPAAIIEKINRDVVRMLEAPEVRAKFETQAFLARSDTPEQFQRIMREEAARYAGLLRDGKK